MAPLTPPSCPVPGPLCQCARPTQVRHGPRALPAGPPRAQVEAVSSVLVQAVLLSVSLCVSRSEFLCIGDEFLEVDFPGPGSLRCAFWNILSGSLWAGVQVSLPSTGCPCP